MHEPLLRSHSTDSGDRGSVNDANDARSHPTSRAAHGGGKALTVEPMGAATTTPPSCCHRNALVRDTLLPLVALAWPTSLTGFCTVALPLVSLIFGGRLGRQELAAVGLATMLANVSGASVIQGLLTAYDTLGSQVCSCSVDYRRGLC